MLLPTLWLLAGLTTSSTFEQLPALRDESRELYRTACAACHGSDGRGQPRHTVGFDTPLPDFTDCAFATPEPDADWMAIVHSGGPIRAFNRRMPAFGEALSERQMQQTIDYARRFCVEGAWPRGELNLPRALVTEKAFPENEAVLSTVITSGDLASVEYEFLYERRLGARAQFEIAVPIAHKQDATGGWQSGLGDVAFALKHALFHSLDAGTIVSAAAEFVVPSGKENQGLGSGITVFEPFVAIGQMLPSDGFVQFQAGVGIPWAKAEHSREAFWRTAIGKSFTQGRFGRCWAPMLEVIGAKELEPDERAEWDLVPQMQVTLSKRQHIMMNLGVRVPVTERGQRDVRVLAYLLWDWFDGGIFDGWR
jgi:Cytochrome C oxidase, cbb3-type, subunit III